jgi:hypothetical protein
VQLFQVAANLLKHFSDVETREGWPLLTIETEANGDSRVQMKGVLPWLVRWAGHAGTSDFSPALAALVGPVQNIYFFQLHYFN